MDKLKMETSDLTQSNIEKLNISDNVIKETAKRQPLRAVFRDSGFADSPAKINVREIFKMLAPYTRVKVI